MTTFGVYSKLKTFNNEKISFVKAKLVLIINKWKETVLIEPKHFLLMK